MNEAEVKQLCKLTVQYGNKNLTDVEKEAIKTAIDSSETINDLLAVVLMMIAADSNRS